jgi:hypothetical protein
MLLELRILGPLIGRKRNNAQGIVSTNDNIEREKETKRLGSLAVRQISEQQIVSTNDDIERKKETKRLRSLAVRQISPLYALGLDGMKIFLHGVKKC